MLEGKVAIVTGAAQGIGEVYAQHLAEQGAAVVLADLSLEGVQDNADRLKEEGLLATPHQVDISNPEECEKLVEATAGRNGRIDVLVNNAAIYQGLRMSPAEDLPLEVWRRVLDVNISGMYYMCRAVIPHMKRQRAGVIINQTSGSIWTCPPGMIHYVTSKAAAIPMTKVLARELGPFGVRVNAIAPGLTDTAATHDVAAQQAIDASIAAAPMGRLAVPNDLCGILSFLCSDAASFITGQTIAVNGGSNMIP
jgi:NAD(P)-dependent dehydrogenase (short-subunit alcohol dehydrogenase family)